MCWHNVVLMKVHNGHWEKVLYYEGAQKLEQAAQWAGWCIVPVGQCSRDISVVPSGIYCNFWLALQMDCMISGGHFQLNYSYSILCNSILFYKS